MDLREESLTGENLEKDVTLNEETVESATESVNEKTETTSEVITLAEETAVSGKAHVDYSSLTKSELVDALVGLLDEPIDSVRDAVSQIKMAFYAIRKAEIEAEKAEFLAKGNEEAAFAAAEDTEEARLKDVLGQLKEKRAEYNNAQEALRMQNLERKRAIIDEIKAIAVDPDSVNKQYNRVQQLQQEFKSIGEVPATDATELWKDYQQAAESFYDLLKINKELRDYDFKKNLEIKQQLCADAETLAEKDDVVLAFRRLQELHNQWRETGPVAKELREELWNKFKDASSVINKKYQAFFEDRKSKEKENETAKVAICEKLESLDLSGLKTYLSWDDATKAVIALQEEWKKLGFASRKVNADLFARFRKSCDDFFAKKAEFFKTMKEELSVNLQKKIALCEKAEALKDSTDWKKTSDQLVALQKEWKTIGAVAKKQSDAVWKRFITACDAFFEAKNKQTSSTRKVEHDNLKAKKEIIAAINAVLSDETETEGGKKVRELMKKWQEVGHVPFKEKDKIYTEYKEAIDKAFEKFDMKEVRAALSNYENSISQMTDKDKIYREREYLVRSYEQKRNELKTFENNMGFFNATSKNGNSMLKEMERRIQKIKDDLALIEKKITLIDSKV
ncbi:MAG: DUF349 domain-containing protein [Muribaculaceae bacterium]|nr:DUF349 domain-containing protein [Muribaculaceae bacterium]